MNRSRTKIIVIAVLALALMASASGLYYSGKLAEWSGKPTGAARAAHSFAAPKLIEQNGQFLVIQFVIIAPNLYYPIQKLMADDSAIIDFFSHFPLNWLFDQLQ